MVLEDTLGMAMFPESAEAFWRAPLVRGEVLVRVGPLTIVSNPALAEDRGVTIINLGGAGVVAALSPATAARVLSRPIRNESQLRKALAAAPAQDLDDAYVELDHWAVFGAFRGEQLVCAASMYPWGDSDLGDLGVIALPAYRRQGLSRSVVRALCRHAYGHGLEPQYRCQLDNTASRALAASAGFTWFGNWETVST